MPKEPKGPAPALSADVDADLERLPWPHSQITSRTVVENVLDVQATLVRIDLQLMDRPDVDQDMELIQIRDALNNANMALGHVRRVIGYGDTEEPEPFFEYEPRRKRKKSIRPVE